MYFFVHQPDRKLIGNGGFKGKPDEAGTVEIGYAVAPAYRRKGLATEAAQGLIDFAFSHPQIRTIQAHTLAEENESVRVLRKVGMKFVKELNDLEDGDIWQWQLKREV
jgi:RimJ/RimL family protein N-acetyltransferase